MNSPVNRPKRFKESLIMSIVMRHEGGGRGGDASVDGDEGGERCNFANFEFLPTISR